MEWKIAREKIELIPHPDPTVERLELGKLGNFQVVTQKGLYKDGDIVIFVPDKSVLPREIADEGDMRKYLVGPERNRVKAIKLQKELSCGLLLPDREEFKDIPIGEDISAKLNITKYEPPIPVQLRGKVKPVGNIDTGGKELTHHDCGHLNINKDLFIEGEEILCTEKLHGSQFVLVRTTDGKELISSKGMFKQALVIEFNVKNAYWIAAIDCKIFEFLTENFANKHIQVFGEIVGSGIQKGFSYGFQTPTLKVFRMEVDGVNLPYDNNPEFIRDMWVPILYRGPLNTEKLGELRKGNESVSGRNLHIKEGIVISPLIPRKFERFGEGYIYLKWLNPAYKETGEEFN